MIAHPRRSPRKVASASLPKHDHEKDYAAFLSGIQATFDAAIADGSRLFTTDTAHLFDAFLGALPAERDIHTCSACHRFIKEFGGLVTITEEGQTVPAMWDVCPDFYRLSVLNLAKAVRRARVTGPYLSSTRTWGIPHTGDWTHMAVDATPAAKLHDRLLTSKQAMAAKREDYRTVATALADFTEPMLREALRLFETESVHRSEKFIAPVQWLLDLHTKRAALKGPARDNMLWRAIASAPDGFCHPRASVIGSLLEDIAAAKPFEAVRTAFNAKVHGLIYQRPQAAPTAGNVAAAEKIVEALGIAPSLPRRFARLEDLETAWLPTSTTEPATGGVFSHLKRKADAATPPLRIPPVTVTWAKFAEVLADAERLDYLVEHGGFKGIALTAPIDPEAPGLFKWPNKIAWYCHGYPSAASVWNLRPTEWVPVTAVVALPTMWGDHPQPHLGEGFVLVLNDCHDMRRGRGNALFPECLKGELHQVRATIEAYSRTAELDGRDAATACGRDIRKGQPIGATVRVLKNGVWTAYTIDRWD